MITDRLGTTLDGLMRLAPGDAGLQMLGWLREDWSDLGVAQEASEARIEIAPLSIARRLPPAVGAFTPDEITQGAANLATLIHRHAARTGGAGRKFRR